MIELYIFLTSWELLYFLASLVAMIILILLLDYFCSKNIRWLLYRYRIVALILILLFPQLIGMILLFAFMGKMLIKDFIWEIFLLLSKSFKRILKWK